MTKRRLPILVEESIGAIQTLRTDMGSKFEMSTRNDMAREGRRITCTTGCASCCYHPIHISLFEGITIYRWLQQNNRWTLGLREKLKRVSEQQYGTSYEVWLLSLIPCPLLTEDNKCSAYKARPLICRTYYATNDPHFCHPHRLGPETSIVHRADTVDRFHAEQEKILRSHKLQFLLMPIGAAVLLGERVCSGEIELHEIDSILYREYVEKG